jgi:hypothetical protein
MKKLFILGPLFLTVLLIAWTALVAPHSRYGDNWAIYPALPIFPLAVIWHLMLLIFETPKKPYILYAIGHLSILVNIYAVCLVLISKDSP